MYCAAVRSNAYVRRGKAMSSDVNQVRTVNEVSVANEASEANEADEARAGNAANKVHTTNEVNNPEVWWMWQYTMW